MATQQIVSSAQHNSAVVVPITKATPQAITQTELVLFLSLRGRLQQLQEQVDATQDDLKARLDAGAIVQPGDHVARLDERSRRNVAWRSVAEDLADTVFGEGKGEAYCEEVFASTTPTPTVSLVVR
jgi:hypothetical protein